MRHKQAHAGRLRTIVATLVAVLAGMEDAWACPVCFGASDSPMAGGMNAGIFVLLGVTAAVLVAIAVVGWRIAGRARGQAGLQDAAPVRVQA